MQGGVSLTQQSRTFFFVILNKMCLKILLYEFVSHSIGYNSRY